MCHKIVYTIVQCFHQFDQEFQAPNYNSNPLPMATMLVTSEVVNNSCWFLDSEATNHCTPKREHLMNNFAYDGPKKIYMGNEECEFIFPIGETFLHLSHSSRVFHLCNLLHIPHLTKNLISVLKFAQDNKVFFEFHPIVCFVKNQAISATLLYEKLENDLYAFHMRASSLPTIKPLCPRSSTASNITPNKTPCATSHGCLTRQVLSSTTSSAHS